MSLNKYLKEKLSRSNVQQHKFSNVMQQLCAVSLQQFIAVLPY